MDNEKNEFDLKNDFEIISNSYKESSIKKGNNCYKNNKEKNNKAQQNEITETDMLWKNDIKHINFLKWIENYMIGKRTVDSDSFFYHEDDLDNYSPDEFQSLLSKLCINIFNYAKENNISRDVDNVDKDICVKKSCYFKINEKIYLVQNLVGGNSYYHVELLDNVNMKEIEEYVDYKKMMNYINCIKYKKETKDKLFQKLKKIEEEINLDNEGFITLLNEYINIKESEV